MNKFAGVYSLRTGRCMCTYMYEDFHTAMKTLSYFKSTDTLFNLFRNEFILKIYGVCRTAQLV